ncbi:MAG: putative baseplate assembly protein [Firmicutes bacterium]|nr:putative baseplate assembly protein [Bacillota bacterium]
MLSPKIDSKDLQDLIEQMRKMAPHYTPEWRFSPSDPDPGTALFMLFAKIFMGNIERFNKVPLKNFIAFLNMLNVSLLPPAPASTFVTFRLSTGASEPVLIPAGTQVSASADDGGGTVVFETEGNILAVPVSVETAYNVSVEKDEIVPIKQHFFSGELVKPGTHQSSVTLFNTGEEEDLQEHSLYLGHATLFMLREPTLVELEMSNSWKQFKEAQICEKLTDSRFVEWSYSTEDGWELFDEVRAEGNRLVLKKDPKLEVTEKEIDGIVSRWIRCLAKKTQTAELDDVEIDGINAGAEYFDSETGGGLPPDMLFCNDVQLTAEAFYPVGKYFNSYDTFYLSSREALSKKGSTITLSFKLQHVENMMQSDLYDNINWKMIMKKSDLEEPEPPRVSVLNVSWEYWNGTGWVNLLEDKDYKEIFYYPAVEKKDITFMCPVDLEETYVNDIPGYWIRVRVVNIENNYAVNSVYRSPWIENIELKYRYPYGKIPVEHCLTYNNLEYKYRTLGNGEQNLFRPFYSLECQHPAFYLGLDAPPLRGPISVFFSLERKKETGENPPLVEWEYLRKDGIHCTWSPLKTQDRTKGFSRSGNVMFVGSQDFARGKVFGRDLYWIRAVNGDGKYENEGELIQAPNLQGIYFNTAKVVQQESLEDEIFEAVYSEDPIKFSLATAPVTYEEVWVNEVGFLAADQLQQLSANDLTQVKEVKDAEGKLEEIWVKWRAVDGFFESQEDDRHYVIDRSSGILYFGDGKCGKSPPVTGTENIIVRSKTGGGTKGNLDVGQIINLENSIAYVDSVFNPESSGGGCDVETFEEAVRRGPQALKHMGRAVTAEDFEWLARQCSQNVAKVKCLPNINSGGERETGCVTIVVVPKSNGSSGVDFLQLKQELETYLVSRAASMVALPGKLQVVEPVYMEISIYAVVVVDNMDIVIATEREALEKLEGFLDPLTGNHDGNGWEIGRYPHISMFYALLNAVNTVNYVEKVFITVYERQANKRVEINIQEMAGFPHGLVARGENEVEVKVS